MNAHNASSGTQIDSFENESGATKCISVSHTSRLSEPVLPLSCSHRFPSKPLQLQQPPPYINTSTSFTTTCSVESLISALRSFISLRGSFKRMSNPVSTSPLLSLPDVVSPSWDARVSFDSGEALHLRIHLYQLGDSVVCEVQRLNGNPFVFRNYFDVLLQHLRDIDNGDVSPEILLKDCPEGVECHTHQVPPLQRKQFSSVPASLSHEVLAVVLEIASTTSFIDTQCDLSNAVVSISQDEKVSACKSMVSSIGTLLHSSNETVQRLAANLLANLASRDSTGHCSIVPLFVDRLFALVAKSSACEVVFQSVRCLFYLSQSHERNIVAPDDCRLRHLLEATEILPQSMRLMLQNTLTNFGPLTSF